MQAMMMVFCFSITGEWPSIVKRRRETTSDVETTEVDAVYVLENEDEPQTLSQGEVHDQQWIKLKR